MAEEAAESEPQKQTYRCMKHNCRNVFSDFDEETPLEDKRCPKCNYHIIMEYKDKDKE